MEDLTQYDIKPQGFINYLRYNGQHFNKHLLEFAIKRFKLSITKEKLSTLCQTHNIAIPENIYDALYILNWAKDTLWGSSIQDDKHLVLFMKDIMDKESNLVFNRWYADQAKQGMAIEWEDMI